MGSSEDSMTSSRQSNNELRNEELRFLPAIKILRTSRLYFAGPDVPCQHPCMCHINMNRLMGKPFSIASYDPDQDSGEIMLIQVGEGPSGTKAYIRQRSHRQPTLSTTPHNTAPL
jgi:hypothetical protein